MSEPVLVGNNRLHKNQTGPASNVSLNLWPGHVLVDIDTKKRPSKDSKRLDKNSSCLGQGIQRGIYSEYILTMVLQRYSTVTILLSTTLRYLRYVKGLGNIRIGRCCFSRASCKNVRGLDERTLRKFRSVCPRKVLAGKLIKKSIKTGKPRKESPGDKAHNSI